MASLHADLDALKAIASSLLRQFAKGSKTSLQLQSLLDATSSIQIAVLQKDFRKRSDAPRLLRDIEDLAGLAKDNLDDLQLLIHPNRDRRSNRSPKSEAEETARNQNIFSNLQKHTSTFQRLGDYIADREDWSRLTPKAPRAPSASPDSTSRLQPVEKGKATISTPTSPFQPFVEDIEDADADEEVKYNVEHVHYVHKDDSPITPVDKISKANPRRVVPPQTPPQVVIRQATDPKQFESPPRKPADPSASPLRTASGVDDDVDSDNEKNKGPESHLHPSSLPKIVTNIDRPASKSLQELEDEIARLNRELQKKYSEGETSASDSSRPEMGKRKTSGKHHSVDLGRTNSLSAESGPRRPRSSTSQNSDRPRSFVDSTGAGLGPGFDPYRSDMPPPSRSDGLRRASSTKSRPPLSRSPRSAPFSTNEAHMDSYLEHGYPHSANEMYGPDPRTSLPTVLEGNKRDSRSARTGRSMRNATGFEDPRDNFHDFFRPDDPGAADFPLFGPGSGQPPPPIQGRSRGNSRAKNDTSPNSKPYISPHQLHESLPIEPDVREISVSLEDVFWGVDKKIRLRRDRYNPQTRAMTQEECIMEVPISRGLKPKSKIKFEGEGHQTPEGTRELHLQLTEKPHSIFTRVDYDLHCTFEITLVEALCGWEKTIKSICGKDVRFSHSGPTSASWHDDRAGLGMCKFKDPSIRGDLIAGVSIRYPATPLSESQKRLIRQALGGGPSPRSSGTFF